MSIEDNVNHGSNVNHVSEQYEAVLDAIAKYNPKAVFSFIPARIIGKRIGELEIISSNYFGDFGQAPPYQNLRDRVLKAAKELNIVVVPPKKKYAIN